MIAISGATLAAIAVVVVTNGIALSAVLVSRRADRAHGAGAGSARGSASLTRREFFRRSLVGSLAVFGAQFGAATLAFLWPTVVGSFGSVLTAGRVADVKRQVAETGQPVYFAPGRLYLVGYEGHPADDVDYAAEGLVADGLMALYQRCVHLGCRVPFCASSRWFECPCHQSKYNGAGEYMSGPAPHGMDRFRIGVDRGDVVVDTAEIILGPPRGTDTTSQPLAGPFCVAST